MLKLSEAFIDRPVLSLRSGNAVARITSPLINPNNLKIEGFFCLEKFRPNNQVILLYQDIREVAKEGLIVNDHEVLTEASDLPRLQDVIKLNFILIGKPVVTVDKAKVGKVSDYAVETESMYIQKIYVATSILRNLTTSQLIIDRNQINEVTNRRIIINDLNEKMPVSAPAIV